MEANVHLSEEHNRKTFISWILEGHQHTSKAEQILTFLCIFMFESKCVRVGSLPVKSGSSSFRLRDQITLSVALLLKSIRTQ